MHRASTPARWGRADRQLLVRDADRPRSRPRSSSCSRGGSTSRTSTRSPRSSTPPAATTSSAPARSSRCARSRGTATRARASAPETAPMRSCRRSHGASAAPACRSSTRPSVVGRARRARPVPGAALLGASVDCHCHGSARHGRRSQSGTGSARRLDVELGRRCEDALHLDDRRAGQRSPPPARSGSRRARTPLPPLDA